MEDRLGAFESAASFAGPRKGFIFKMGPHGLGYYMDESTTDIEVWEGTGGISAKVEVDQKGTSSFTGFMLWPGARSLSGMLCREPHLVRGCRVLELGAGCGLVSAVAAALGAEVTATDREPLLGRLHRTAALNGCCRTGQSAFSVHPLEWGGDGDGPRLPSGWSAGHFHVVLGSDITYGGGKAMGSLLDLLAALAGPGTLTLLAHQERAPEQAAALRVLLQERWAGGFRLLESSQIQCSGPAGKEFTAAGGSSGANADDQSISIFALQGPPAGSWGRRLLSQGP